MFNELIEQSYNENTFKFTQGTSDYWIKAECEDNKVETMLHELTLSGQDRFGSFQARGFIVEK